MTLELKEKLHFLADKYETTSFLDEDPSQFMKRYSSRRDVETSLFITAMLSFGNRKQFIPKIRSIFDLADMHDGICNWLENGDFESEFVPVEGSCEAVKFYRFYSYEDMRKLFRTLAHILMGGVVLGDFFRREFESEDQNRSAAERFRSVIERVFSDCKIVPKGRGSANKRVHMFLRWMVRRGSPVDLGLWNWYSPADLIIPLDTHVLQEAKKFGMLEESCTASFRTAERLTEELKQVWPDDPCKGDFALFGLGVADNE